MNLYKLHDITSKLINKEKEKSVSRYDNLEIFWIFFPDDISRLFFHSDKEIKYGE